MNDYSEEEFSEYLKAQLLDILKNNLIVYKYIGFETGILAIENSTIGFTNPLFFNDPYDCALKLVDFENIPDGYREYLIDKYISHLSSTEKEKRLEKTALIPDSVVIKLLQTEGIDNEIKSRGVSCFSKNYNNMLMWSHYANSHKGICIGFNLLPLYLSVAEYSSERMVLPINYTDKFTPMNFYKYGFESIIKWLQTKSNVWSYEEEIRITLNHLNFNRRGKSIVKILPSSFNSVYLGANMSAENEAELITLLHNGLPDVPVYKIKPAHDSFELKATPYR